MYGPALLPMSTYLYMGRREPVCVWGGDIVLDCASQRAPWSIQLFRRKWDVTQFYSADFIRLGLSHFNP